MSQNQQHVPSSQPTTRDASSAEQPDSISELLPSETGELDYKYRCQYCGAIYCNELLTRVHITRADDDTHQHRNGLMPEAEIEVVDDSGAVVETVTRRPDEIDPTKLTVDDFPADLTAATKHVLTVAAHHPEASKTTVTDKVEQRLEGSEVSAPVYRTVCDMVNRFYRPHGGDKGNDLAELTEKQQAIVIAHVAAPEKSYAELAEMIGVAQSYPRKVIRQHSHLLDYLETAHEEHDDVAVVIEKELSDDDLIALTDSGLLDRVPIRLGRIRPTADDSASDQESGSEKASDHEASWGSPVEQSTGLRATPETSLGSANGATRSDSDDSARADVDETTTEQAELPQARDKIDTAADKSATDSGKIKDTTNPQIPREAVADLRAKVMFLREIFDRQSQPNGEAELVVSVAKQVEQHCQVLLQRHPDT